MWVGYHQPRTTPTPLAKGNPQTTKRLLTERKTTHLQCRSISTQYANCSPTKHILGALSFVKPSEHGHHGETTNINLLDHPIPCCFGINDELISNPVHDLRLMLMFAIEHFVVANPNGPKRGAPKEVKMFWYLYRTSYESFPKNNLFPIKTIKTASSNPAEFMHNKVAHLQALQA